MYSEYYNNDLIFFDTDVTDEARKSILDIENDMLEYSQDVFLEDKYFDDVPDRYKKLIPNIRFADIKDELTSDIIDATVLFLNNIKAIENAIHDYCDGDGTISSENKVILDYYLGNSKNLFSDDNSDKRNIVDQVVVKNNNVEDLGLSDDEEISMLGDNISSSLYSTTSLDKEKDDKNNVLNYNDISMAAIAALNGKIIYDKQQEVDDNVNTVEFVEDNTSVENFNNNEHFNDGLVLGIESVEFKNDLLDGVIGDD